MPFKQAGIPHSAQMTRENAQTISTGTVTVVEFDTLDYENGIDAQTGASAKFVIKKAGKYLIVASWITQAELGDGESAQSRIHINGDEVKTALDLSPKAAGQVVPIASGIFELNVDDEVDFRIFHEKGSNMNTRHNTDSQHPRMSIIEIR